MNLKSRLKDIANRNPIVQRLDKQLKKVMVPISLGIVLRIMRSGVSFVFNFLLARLLGAEGAGVFFLAYSVTRISTIVGRVGLDKAMLRFAAAKAANEDWAGVAGVARTGLAISAGLSTLLTFILLVAAKPIAIGIFSEPTLVEPLRWMALSIVPWSMLLLISKLLQGLEHIQKSLFIEGVGVMLINIPFMIIASLNWGVTGVAITFVISNCLVMIIAILMWRKITPQLRGLKGNPEIKPLMGTSIQLFWAELTVPTINMTDTFMLGIIDDLAAVGVFSLVKRVAGLTSANLTVVGAVYSPKFAKLYEKGEMETLSIEARNSAVLSTILALPYLLLIAIAPFWLGPVFGAEYAIGIPALMILALGKFIGSATGAVGTLLVMTGHEKEVRNIAIGTSTLKVILQFILIPTLGITGAALASAISSSTRNIISTVVVYTKLSMWTLPVPKRMVERLSARRAEDDVKDEPTE